jgi:hypothetical protein
MAISMKVYAGVEILSRNIIIFYFESNRQIVLKGEGYLIDISVNGGIN